jgi:hypothetical protein
MSSGLCTDISALQKDIITGLESVKDLLDKAMIFCLRFLYLDM